MVTTKSSSLQKGCPTYFKRCYTLKDFEIALQRPFMLTCSPVYKEYLTRNLIQIHFQWKNVCLCVQKYFFALWYKINKSCCIYFSAWWKNTKETRKVSLTFADYVGLFSQNLKGLPNYVYLFIAAMALRSFSWRNWSKACSASLSSLSILWSAISSSRNSVSKRFFSVRFTVREY